jgi:hypothetical protein
LREGLLPKAKAPLTTCCTLLAGVDGDGRPVSSTSSGIPPFSFSCELEGPIASLLGTGVRFLTAVFLKAGFLTGTAGFAIALTAFDVSLALRTPLVELGVVLEGAFEKKLWMDRWPDCGPELELCFFREGGAFAGVAVDSSLTLAIFAASSSIQAVGSESRIEEFESKLETGD